MDRLLNAMSVLSVLLILLVLASVRRAHIRVEYSVSWLVFAVVLLILSRSQSLLEAVASHLGITYAPLALLLLVTGAALLMFFRFSVIISKLKDNNIALAQRLAILEYHIHNQKRAAS